jgi:uncharacterized membrane protein
MELKIKQGLVWGISFVIGTGITSALIQAMDTDIETYSWTYFILTIIFISMCFVIWGDYLLGAEILPD